MKPKPKALRDFEKLQWGMDHQALIHRFVMEFFYPPENEPPPPEETSRRMSPAAFKGEEPLEPGPAF